MEIARTEIRLSYSAPEAPLLPCSSRIGGCPAVPADFVWPEYTGEGYDGETRSRPLAFLAQINLKEVAGFDPDELLPKRCSATADTSTSGSESPICRRAISTRHG